MSVYNVLHIALTVQVNIIAINANNHIHGIIQPLLANNNQNNVL